MFFWESLEEVGMMPLATVRVTTNNMTFFHSDLHKMLGTKKT